MRLALVVYPLNFYKNLDGFPWGMSVAYFLMKKKHKRDSGLSPFPKIWNLGTSQKFGADHEEATNKDETGAYKLLIY